MIPKYDRLNGIDTEEETFDFICPKCKADGIKDSELITLDLIGVVTKPDTVDNSDLPKKIADVYNRLPTMRQAILNFTQDTEKEQMFTCCRDCGPINVSKLKYNKVKLRKWVNKPYPEILIL